MSSRKYNSKKKILSGIISVHPHGFGFVNPALSQLNNSEITEIFIPAQDVNLAIDGDEVLVDHINNKKDKGWEGKVKKIVKRGRKSLVCQFLKYNRFNKPLFECQLLDDRIVLIDNKKLGKIVNQGDIYKIYINDWGKHKRDVLRAFYLGKYLGNINDSKIDKKIIEYQYRLPYSYDILHEKFSFKKPSFKPSSKRIDLSRQITFTIDPDASKDFDDAIFIDYHIKKNSYNIIIDSITLDEKKKLIQQICHKEKLNFDPSDNIEEYLSEIVNNDIRQLILALQELKYMYQDKVIRKSDIKLSHLKNNKKDFSLFESSHKIFNKKLTLRESQSIYEIDSFFIPLMLFENYNLFETYPISKENFKHIMNMNEYFSICDNLDKEIFKNQFWNLKQYQSILLCYHMSLIMSDTKHKDIKPIFNSINDIKYTLYPSKISNQLLIKKYLYNFYKKFNLNHNFDSLNIIHKFRFILLILLENLDQNSEFIKFFTMDVSEIEQISKILKSNQTKINFTYKFKTLIKKSIES
tara:strand:- start:1798 stop:3366 length:1569 start_codon:yes stop_codon:yes gene_type:complete